MTMILPFQTMLGQEPLQVTRIRDYINSGSFVPHRHQFYMLLWITEGQGEHEVDFDRSALQPNRVFSVSEGQVHQIITPATDGWMLTFQSNVYYALAEGPGGIDVEEIFSNAFIDLTESEAGNFLCLWNLLRKTAQANGTDPMLINQLRVLLGCLHSCADQRNRQKKHPVHYPVLQQLRRMINTHFREQSEPNWYAATLEMPLWKLNAWCREAFGHNVHDLLTARVILEAKALLTTTNIQVKEITYELGLEDPSNFAKTFKRLTGMTPLEYRERRVV